MDDFAPMLNENLDGWSKAMGLRFVRVTLDEVVAAWTVGPEHRQAYGIVHGGVHCGVIETLASVGAAMNALQHGRTVVGLENATSFLHAVREGTLTCTARPVSRGRRSQVWEAVVEDESGRKVAIGRVRLMVLEPEAQLAGKKAALE